MNWTWIKIISKRFAKIFVLGGLSGALVAVAQNPLKDFSELNAWLPILVTAFLTGGLAAIEKWTQGWNPQ